MKKILVATDFSPAAAYAARYALHLACYLRTDIELLHTFEIPVMATQAASYAWSEEDDKIVKDAKLEHLGQFITEVKKDLTVGPQSSWIPEITPFCEKGDVFDEISREKKENAFLLAMGTSSTGPLNRFFFGSKVRRAICETGLPVLMVPPLTKFKKLKKIAFATDLRGNDLEILHALSGLARPFNAEILIVHITEEKTLSPERQKAVKSFLKEVAAKANYPKIYYRHVNGMSVNDGLTWLSEHGHVDLLAMVHRPNHLLYQIFKGSHTLKMTDQATLPMLVFTEEASLAGFMRNCL